MARLNGGVAAPVPRVLLGVPYAKDFPGPFVIALLSLLEAQGKTYDVKVAPVPNTAVHVARTLLVREALQGGFDYLCMVDSDQTFGAETLTRLLSWEVPVVAPVIVARQGDPIPVAYTEEGQDIQGDVHYAHLGEEVWAYLSQFAPVRLRAPYAVLPKVPDHAAEMLDIPEPVQAGLESPLLACDAVGAGMVLIARRVLQRVQPDEKGFYFDWARGGEDLSFMRRVRAAGFGGFTAGPHPDRERIFVDRGCLVGHLSYYARGGLDLAGWLLARTQEGAVEGGDDQAILASLAEELADDGAVPTPGEWQDEPLPEALAS